MERWLEDPIAVDLGQGKEFQALVLASRAAIEASHREAEAVRQRELEQAQALAIAERARAEDHARASRRLRRRLMFATAAALLAVLAATAAYVGFDQARAERERAQQEQARAEQEARIASARSLAGQSNVQLQFHNDELASLLALQAFQFNGGAAGAGWGQVDTALRQTMAAPYFSRVLRQGAAVETLAFDPRGSAVAIGHRDGTVWVRNPREPTRQPTVLQRASDWVTSLAFAPDGRLLAVGTRDGTISLYRTDNYGLAPTTLEGAPGRVSSLAVSGNALLATIDRDPSVYEWDLRQVGTPTSVKPTGGTQADEDAVDPSGRSHVVGRRLDGALHVWDVARPDQSFILPNQAGWNASSVSFGAMARTLIASGEDGTLRLWNLADKTAMPTALAAPSSTATIRAVAIHPDGQRVAAITAEGTVLIWSLAARSEPTILRGHENTGIMVAFSPDGRTLATGGGDAARLWELDPPPQPTTLRGHEDGVLSVAYSSGGQLLASAGLDGVIRLWDTTRPDLPPMERAGHEDWVLSVAFSPDGRTLASGGRDRTLRLWRADDESAGIVVLTASAAITSVAFGPDGRTLAAGDQGGAVTVVDTTDLRVLRTLSFQGGIVQSIAVSPSGATLAAGGCLQPGTGATAGVCNRGGVLLWSLQRPDEPHRELLSAENSVLAVSFAPDGRRLAVGGRDGLVQIADTLDSASVASPLLGGGSSDAASVAWSPTTEALAVSHRNGTISVWQLSHPSAPSQFSASRGFTNAVAYAPDGQSLAVAGSDGAVHIWASTDALARMICDRVGRNLAPQEWRQFVGEAVPYRTTCSSHPPGEETDLAPTGTPD